MEDRYYYSKDFIKWVSRNNTNKKIIKKKLSIKPIKLKHKKKSNNYRRIYEEFYNCCLMPYTIIHHIDGNRRYNSIYNLEATSKYKHPWMHAHKYYFLKP